MTIGGAGTYTVSVVLPRIQADFGIARGDASLPYSAVMIGFALGGIFMGRLADRVGDPVHIEAQVRKQLGPFAVLDEAIGDAEANDPAGIEAGLSICPTAYMAVFPCDAPLLDSRLLANLYQTLERTNANIVYATSRQGDDTYPEPTFALIRTCMLGELRTFLDTGRRKLLDWYQSTDYAECLFEESLCFANANTAEELKRLASLSRPA